MKKLIAIVNVTAWAGFWAFGYLALSADVEDTSEVVTALVLAALGGGVGMLAYLWLARQSDVTRNAKRPKRADDQDHGEVL